MTVDVFESNADSRAEGVEFQTILSASRLSDIFFMRLSVVSVVSFQGLFGVEVRTYKVLTKNTSQPQGAGKIFCQIARLDLVRP